jgi:glycosyltransferase involved in cell wall biosynthesis
MARVSAIIVCFNEEDNIRDCLESVRWADEIVVVDSHSTDRTVEIAREYTDRIFIRDWAGYREQKQFALDQARAEWVLNLDADERVSRELRAEVHRELSAEDRRVAGFYISSAPLPSRESALGWCESARKGDHRRADATPARKPPALHVWEHLGSSREHEPPDRHLVRGGSETA